jgi:hypothetical protein
MKTKSRSTAFIGIAFALMAPCLAFVIYSVLRFPQGGMPDWFAYVTLVWFAGVVVVMTLLAKRMFKKNASDDAKSLPSTSLKATRTIWIMRIVGSYLVAVWTVLLIIGVKGTIEGKYQLIRAIPAGLFLLFFIGIFGWSIYRTFKPKA